MTLDENRNASVALSGSIITAVLFLLLGLSGFAMGLSAPAQESLSAIQIVNQMVQTETAAKNNREYFMYRKQEKSTRTRGHLWDELVIETPGGRIQRLVSEDGKPLSGSQEKSEDNRIAYMATHPGEFRRQSQTRKDDEARMAELLKKLPKIFLFKITGSSAGCASIAFQPNPSFQEESYQDRVLHAMSGALLIHTPDMHLCGLHAQLEHRVEFAFGILGEVSNESHFSITRQEICPGQWKMTKIDVHVAGSILLMKSLSRNEDSLHYGFKSIPSDLTLTEAAAMVRSTTF